MSTDDLVILNGITCKVMVCGNCGVTHALPAIRYDTCRDEGGFWFCPNGHQRGFVDSASVRADKERERQRVVQENARLQDEVREAQRATEKVEAKLHKHQRRVAAGVCPCCNRTFAKLAMHMKLKHPTFNVIPLKAASA